MPACAPGPAAAPPARPPGPPADGARSAAGALRRPVRRRWRLAPGALALLLLLAAVAARGTAAQPALGDLAPRLPDRSSASDAADASSSSPPRQAAGAAAAAVRKAVAAVKDALADVGAGPSATRSVDDAAGLARALQDPDVRAINLAQDVELTPDNWGSAGPVLVTRRTIIKSDPPGAQRVLDFGRMQSALLVSEGTRLVFGSSVWLRGLAPRDGVAVDVAGFARLRPAGMSLWPSVIMLPNATLGLVGSRVDYIADADWGPRCTNFRARVGPQLAGLGYADARFEGATDLVLPDLHGFDVPLQNLAERGAPVVGQVAIRTDGVVLSCVPPPPPGTVPPAGGGGPAGASSSSSPPPGATVVVTDESTGGRGSIGVANPEYGRGRGGGRPAFHWWQGLAIGLTAGLVALLSVGVVILSRRVRQLSGGSGRLSGLRRPGRSGGTADGRGGRGGGGGGGGGLLPLFRRRRLGAAAPAVAMGKLVSSNAVGDGPRDDSAADVTPPPKGGARSPSASPPGGAGGAALPLAPSSSATTTLLLRAKSSEAASDVELGPLLGRGSYGKVFKAKWRGSLVAVKVVDADVAGGGGGGGGPGGSAAPAGGGTGATEAAASAAARESALAQAISHPHVVSTYKVLTVPVSVGGISLGGGGGGGGGGGSGGSAATGLTPTRGSAPGGTAPDGDGDGTAPPPAATHIETWIILEYCDRGSLEAAIAQGRFMRADGARDLAAIYAVLRDVAAGMEYLASLGVVHADLKPANILLKSTAADARGYKALLSDFGLSKVLEGGTHMSTRTYGTIAYMPPELIRDGKLSSAADVFGFGVLMWTLFSGTQPYDGLPTATVFYKVAIEGARPDVDPAMPPEYVDLMTACWAADPAKRPSFKAIYKKLVPLAATSLAAARAARVAGGGGSAASLAGGGRQGSGASAGVGGGGGLGGSLPGSVGGSPPPAQAVVAAEPSRPPPPPPPPPPPAAAADAAAPRPLPPPVRPGPFGALARQLSPFRRSLSRQRSGGGGGGGGRGVGSGDGG